MYFIILFSELFEEMPRTPRKKCAMCEKNFDQVGNVDRSDVRLLGIFVAVRL